MTGLQRASRWPIGIETTLIFSHDQISIHIALTVLFFALPNTLPGILKAFPEALAK